MRVSPQKRAANRRNALKSTGPKTVLGRRASAQNSFQHGLSVPLPTHLADPVQHKLVQLIISDGFDHEVADNLAHKMIEYERNMQYLNEIFQNDIALANDPSTKRGAAILEQEEIQEDLFNILKEIEQDELRVMNRLGLYPPDRKLLQAIKQCKKLCKGLIRLNKMFEIKRTNIPQRYFKRASNQLIKALKRL